MLLEFGAKNFFSFKEGFEVSLRLNSSCPEKISHNKNYTSVLAVKGANASGKTNVLKLLSFIQDFTLNSFSSDTEDEIKFNSYFNNSEISSLYIVFSEKKIEYTYEVELTNQKIISEIIYKKDKRKTKIIERKNDKIIYTSKAFDELKIIKLKSKSSLISTAKQYEIDSINLIYNLFNGINTNVYSLGRHDGLPDYNEISKFYKENKDIFKFVQDTLKKSDTGIDSIDILTRENEETGKIVYFPVFNYDIKQNKKFLVFHNQSSGVKSLYQQLGKYKIVLDNGGILALDEFDINLHPDLLPMLIDFFDDNEKNINNAQLIFTTHNSDIMDELGKYRVVLVNKKDNESFLYRLDEIPGDILRNDRSISSVYNTGKIGGKPKISHGQI
jgi:AAA15 family ATPase/GTPase